MPLSRKRALEMVSAIPGRTRAINDDVRYLHYIHKVAVFGSFLRDKDPLGDLDIAIDFRPRLLPHTKQMKKDFERHFPPPAYIKNSFVDRLWWPELKLKRDFTIGRLMRVHDFNELGYLECEFRILFEDKELPDPSS